MDNLTHSLVGYVIAKTAKHLKIKGLTEKFKDPKTSSFLIFVSILAANFPDLDLLYSLYDSSKLGYLVHHRGHTHTFIFAIPQAILALILSALIFKIKDKIIWSWALVLIIINICIHITLDALNIYGIHPFYPWDNQWYYGDRVFIIEPWVWFSILPLALTPLKKIISFKMLFVLIFLVVILFAVKIQMIFWGTALILGIYFIALIILSNRILESTKTLMALSFSILALLGFIVEGFIVKANVSSNLQDQSFYRIQKMSDVNTQKDSKNESISSNSEIKLIDLAITPYPGNPFCWNIFSVRLIGIDGYEVAQGQYQSRNIIGFKCPQGMFKPIENIIIGTTRVDNINWYQLHQGSKRKIFDSQNDCRLENWFQFVRVPFINDSGEYVDLRFSSLSERKSFVHLDLTDNLIKCVKLPAPWVPPRKDVFSLLK